MIIKAYNPDLLCENFIWKDWNRIFENGDLNAFLDAIS